MLATCYEEVNDLSGVSLACNEHVGDKWATSCRLAARKLGNCFRVSSVECSLKEHTGKNIGATRASVTRLRVSSQ